MATPLEPSLSSANELAELRRAGGDPEKIAAFFERYRERLRRMIQFRLDRRLQARVDPSDVIQDACLEALDRLDEFLAAPTCSPYVWLRFIAAQRLLQLGRHHLGAQIRDVRREVRFDRSVFPVTTSIALAEHFVAEGTSPSGALAREERRAILQEALEGMDELDRAILELRYFEGLSNAEAAELLDLNESTASTRFVRALKRIRKTLDRSLDPGA